MRISPRSLKQSWSWYVALQLLLNKFLLTRFGLGDWKGLFGAISRAIDALMAMVSRRRGRLRTEPGRHWAPAVAGWRAFKEKPCYSFHSLHRALALSATRSCARSEAALADVPPRYSAVA